MRNSLIIGMGIGQLYKDVLVKLGHAVVTVDTDSSKNADFNNIEHALQGNLVFDTAHVCTPNFTHKNIAEAVAPFAKIIFIEKPGLKNSQEWKDLVEKFPNKRFILVKNNMWRSNICELKDLAKSAIIVNINWVNKDRVPNPGSWFTTRKLSFGGVSRDLMPHLLSLYISLNPNWQKDPITDQELRYDWRLEDLLTTDYGKVNPHGTYDVDDTCYFSFGNKWNLISRWRSMTKDRRNITFIMPDRREIVYELGLCPEDAYQNMIKDALDHLHDLDFWDKQYSYDSWIHQKIENL